MNGRTGRKMIGHFSKILAMAVTMLVAGCSEYLDRRDTLHASSGEAVATNQLTHIRDPWPRHAFDKRIASDGQRMATAVRSYRCGPRQQAAGGQSGSLLSSAPSAAAPSEDC